MDKIVLLNFEEAMHLSWMIILQKSYLLEVSFISISRRVSGFNKRGFIKDSLQTVEEISFSI